MRIFNTPQEAISLITSLIACVTGVSSLIITLVRWLLEKPKAVIEPLAPSLSGFYKHSNKDFTEFKYAIIYNMTISSVRQTPFSIKKVRITVKNEDLPTSRTFDLGKGITVKDESGLNPSRTYYLSDKFEYLHPPRMVKPYETVNLCLLFNGDSVYEIYKQHKELGGDALPVHLRISLSHKEITQRITLKEITYTDLKDAWENFKGRPEDYDITATLSNKSFNRND